MQPGGTYVLGPVWVSTGEGFSPSGTRDFLITIIEVLKARIKEAKNFRQEVRSCSLQHTKVVINILTLNRLFILKSNLETSEGGAYLFIAYKMAKSVHDMLHERRQIVLCY